MAKIEKENAFHTDKMHGYGVIGYRVEFSIKDLYALRAIADAVLVETKNSECMATMLADTIHRLCNNTIGVVTKDSWDFLSNDSAE